MLLKEVELQTEMMKRALQDGIETTEEYQIWLIGYMAGYDDRQAQVINHIKGDGN